jgi:hypothetical protein
MAVNSLIVPPDFTGSVNQEFFIEPLGGAQNPRNYLNNFPRQVFTHDINSNLVALLYALLGPAGIGDLRRDSLIARLNVEAFGLSTEDLDSLYSLPFSFARLASESYEFIPQGLLTAEQWEQIQMADASFRNRAIDFLKGVRAGGTVLGLTLAAKSGLDRPAEVIENYRLLYDHFSDKPLGYEYLGSTVSTEEVIVLPRQDVPTSSKQTITIFGGPNKGHFTLQLPIGSEANSITGELAYNCLAHDVQVALEALLVVGPNNVRVTGGPAPFQPIVVEFTGALADRPLPILIPNVSAGMTNAEGELAVIKIENTQVGVAADSEESEISAADWHHAYEAISRIKPVTTIVTPAKGAGVVRRQVPNIMHSDSAQTFTQVIRYVTGINSVNWPPADETHWIKAGREIEAPFSKFSERQHYTNFHNIRGASAYTDLGLQDPQYETTEWPTRLPFYQSEHIGPFSIYERTLFPFLEGVQEGFRFEPSLGVANPPEALTVQATAQGTSLISGIYPVDYQGLPGVESFPPASYQFWASGDRPSGADYLEIDLGSVQAVNYLTFQVSNKPLDITVAYDILDQAPARRFVNVSLSTVAPSITSVGHSIQTPWETCEINFTNSLNQLIFTRFIRIGFSRRLGAGNPFVLGNRTPVPYGAEVKNLRVGRSL